MQILTLLSSPLADWELAKKFEELEEVRGANAQTHRCMFLHG